MWRHCSYVDALRQALWQEALSLAVCCSETESFAVCCSVLQCVAVCCSVLQRDRVSCHSASALSQRDRVSCCVLQCVAVCCRETESLVTVLLLCVRETESHIKRVSCHSACHSDSVSHMNKGTYIGTVHMWRQCSYVDALRQALWQETLFICRGTVTMHCQSASTYEPVFICGGTVASTVQRELG